MQFLYPGFLLALLALAIPVILHLFHFRRFRKVYFTNVQFLREVKEDTSARSKLRNLLVLLARLLSLAFLVFAFAQPFIPRGTEVTNGRQAVSMFIDNSFSMSALSEDVPLLDKAKRRAREIVEAYSPEDRFQILTHDFAGRQQRLLSKDDALALIDEVEISPEVKNLSLVLTRQEQALDQDPSIDRRTIYQISDFQRSITDLEQEADSTIEVNLVPLQSVQERNVAVDTAWFEAPVQMVNQTNPLLVRIRNYSSESVENVRLSINYEGQNKPVGTLNIPAEGTVVDTVNLTILRTGWHEARLNLIDYPVQFDDQYFLAFKVAEEIQVLGIHEGQLNNFLASAINGLPDFSLEEQTARNLDYSSFRNYQLIVLDDVRVISSGLAAELNEYVNGGGNLLVFLGETADISTYSSFLGTFPANVPEQLETLERKVGDINTQDFVFKDVFENNSSNLQLPQTQKNFRLSRFNDRREERLMVYRDGTTFLAKYAVGAGHLYLCAAPLREEVNDLVRNGEVFVPMLYKMAVSSGRDPIIAYTIGENTQLEAEHQAERAELVYKMAGEGKEFIPQQRTLGSKVFLNVNDQVEQAGFYRLFLESGETLHEFAFNYNRKESELGYYSLEDLRNMMGGAVNIISTANDDRVLTAEIEERSQGIILWRWCLILALLFLLAEVLLLRFWKV